METLEDRLGTELRRLDQEIETLLARRCLLAEAQSLVAKALLPAKVVRKPVKPRKAPKPAKREPAPEPVELPTEAPAQLAEAPAWAVALKKGEPAPQRDDRPTLNLEERVQQFLQFSGPSPVKSIAESVGDTYQRVYNVLIGRNRSRFQQHPRTKEWSLKSHG